MNFDLANQFYCTKCGGRGIPICRKSGKGKEAGHLKRLWCLNCKQECNHVEVKACTHYDYSDFLLEFNYHNFDKDGNRILEYKKFRQQLRKEGIIE